jgi:microcystin degradation protein MlrC
MRVFLGGIVTETNTFSPIPTGARSGRWSATSTTPPEAARCWPVRDEAAARGDELVFGLSAFAMPAGITVRERVRGLREELLAGVRAAMPLDAVILPLHGAMVAEGDDDCEGDVIERVRAIVGEDV